MTRLAALLLALSLAATPALAAKPGANTGANAVPPEPARQRIGSPVVDKGKECADSHGRPVACTAADAVPATPRPAKPAATKASAPDKR